LEFKKCKICDKNFLTKTANQLCCSKECKHKNKNKNWTLFYRKQKGYEPVKEIECIICKNKFIRNSIDQKYCSNDECRLEYLRKKGRDGYYKYKDKIMERRKNNINFCIKNKLRMRISCAVKSQGTYKADKTMNLIGCTINDLKNYLEEQFMEGMTWDNYGLYGWHIDHIIPCVSFDFTKEEEQKKCFHYTNLQPLWARENLRKSGKVIVNESI